MAISGLSWCEFVVYTNKGIFVERIVFDKDKGNISKIDRILFQLCGKTLITQRRQLCIISP